MPDGFCAALPRPAVALETIVDFDTIQSPLRVPDALVDSVDSDVAHSFERFAQVRDLLFVGHRRTITRARFTITSRWKAMFI